MLHIILQVWGGSFYLLNKMFLAIAEHNHKRRRIRIASWVIYLFGLPAWIWIYALQHNWIAASLQTAGAPSMVLGLMTALGHTEKRWQWCLNWTARIVTAAGIGYSWYYFGGIVTLNQCLEVVMACGFLAGAYFTAEMIPIGYLWFILMNVANIVLLTRENYPALVMQQVVSIVVTGYAFHEARKPEQPL